MLDNETKRAIRNHLQEALGNRLCEVIIYGSEARGDAGPQSDIDILVILGEPVRLGEDLEKVTRALYPLQRRLPDRPLHALPVSKQAYIAGACALYRRAKREGISV